MINFINESEVDGPSSMATRFRIFLSQRRVSLFALASILVICACGLIPNHTLIAVIFSLRNRSADQIAIEMTDVSDRKSAKILLDYILDREGSMSNAVAIQKFSNINRSYRCDELLRKLLSESDIPAHSIQKIYTLLDFSIDDLSRCLPTLRHRAKDCQSVEAFELVKLMKKFCISNDQNWEPACPIAITFRRLLTQSLEANDIRASEVISVLESMRDFSADAIRVVLPAVESQGRPFVEAQSFFSKAKKRAISIVPTLEARLNVESSLKRRRQMFSTVMAISDDPCMNLEKCFSEMERGDPRKLFLSAYFYIERLHDSDPLLVADMVEANRLKIGEYYVTIRRQLYINSMQFNHMDIMMSLFPEHYSGL